MSLETATNISTVLDLHIARLNKPGRRAKRKRSPRACLVCRSRKVRCDVLQKSRPCTNCALDGKICIVPNQRRGKITLGGDEHPSSSVPVAEVNHPDDVDDQLERVLSNDQNGLMKRQDFTVVHEVDVDGEAGANEDATAQDSLRWLRDGPSSARASSQAVESTFTELTSNMREDENLASQNDTVPDEFPAASSPAPDVMELFAEREVSYSRYSFIVLNNLRNLGPEDVAYLASQDCLVIPTGETLDHFMEQYFLHVHPLLPLINEGDFWKLYYHGPSDESDKIPLMVFQAILFAASSFVSEAVVKHLGFPHTRAARAAFYKRAKLLYNLDTESSLVSLSQTALLLSFWAPNPLDGQGGLSDCAKNSTEAWLILAIHDAKNAGANLQTDLPSLVSAENYDPEQKRKSSLRRLWWCCLIRDRILALNLRRNIQIKRSYCDPDTLYSDLNDEIHQSRVYNADTKRCLTKVLVQLARLATTLTEVVPLIYPSDDEPRYNNHPGKGRTVKKCKGLLDSWYKSAFSELSGLGSGADNLNPVILYTRFTYIYYYSARIAVCHHEALRLALSNPSSMLDSIMFATICDNQQELRQAISGVSDCLESLIQLGLMRWLPIVALACLALPLMLQILDVKISSMNRNRGAIEASEAQAIVKQRRLTVLIEAVRVYHPRYATVDYICKTIRHVTNLARIESMSNTGTNGGMGHPILSDWTDFLILSPGHYLQLSNALDFSLSKSCLARADDISSDLKLLLGPGSKLPWSPDLALTYQRLSLPNPFAAAGVSWEINAGNEQSDSVSDSSTSHGSEDTALDETLAVSASAVSEDALLWSIPAEVVCEMPPSGAIELGIETFDFGGFPVLDLGQL